MGRSRAAPAHSDDSNQSRSKRKRTISNVENLQATIAGPEMNQGKKSLYHCNYCNKDISGMIRIKCARCQDFDLCVECFSVGAEVMPHKSNHPYRVMDNLSFPLICPDWNLDEEMLLLEGIEMYGFGNWTEVSEHVGTKSKLQCIDHYNTVYMSSPCFPLPDLSHVTGKSREELLAMAKGHSEVKKELPMLGTLSLKEESPVSARVKSEESHKGPAYKSSSSVTAEIGSRAGSSGGKTFPGAVKKAFNTAQNKDPVKVEESQSERRIGEKKPRSSGEEGPSMVELSGYNVKRHEFEIEYDNDAEHLLADMEFKDTDTDAEQEMKLRVLRIYSKRLDERKRRKDFILERNLLYPDPFEKNLSPEEREICQRYKVFMRFHSKEEHEELLKSIIEEYHIVKRIQQLQEARAVGCRTAAEANNFFEQKRKKAEESAVGLKESNLAGSSGKSLPRPNNHVREIESSPRGVRSVQPGATESSSTIAGQAISRSLDGWDITGCIGEDLLSETEKQLCVEIRILPSHYLNMLQTMSVETMKGNITKRSDAYNLFKVDPSKVDKVYDMLVKKGIARA